MITADPNRTPPRTEAVQWNDAPAVKRENYYVGDESNTATRRPLNDHAGYEHLPENPQPEDWTRHDLTDEQLAEMPQRVRTSIEHARFLESATGVNRGGRPAIGPRVHVALPEYLLAMVDRDAERTGFSRAEIIRRAVAIAFRACDQKNLTRIIDEADARGWTHSSHSDLARFIITELADEA